MSVMLFNLVQESKTWHSISNRQKKQIALYTKIVSNTVMPQPKIDIYCWAPISYKDA